MKRYILYLLFLSAITPVSAQMGDEKLLFKAMSDEMARNKEQLVIPGEQRPFVLSYTLAFMRQTYISATLGALQPISEMQPALFPKVEVWTGDYHRVSTIDERSVGSNVVPYFPCDDNYEIIRHYLWLETDAAYKQAIRQWNAKKMWLQRTPLPQKEDSLDDWERSVPVTKIIEASQTNNEKLKEWKTKIAELSAIFKQYPDLLNTHVSLEIVDREIYKLTSEGLKLKQPFNYVLLSAWGSVLTGDGENMGDTYTVMATSVNELPDMETLAGAIKRLADRLVALRQAPQIEEYYIGPVLFEGEAVENLFVNNLLNKKGLFSTVKYDKVTKTIASRLGKKIIDENISIVNYSRLKTYEGKPLLGAYEIDAQGVVPPEQLTLVEKGIFRNLLNDRHPTLKAPTSTGSSRFSTARYVGTTVAPGTIHIKAEKTEPLSRLRKELLKMAKKQDLDYAYIVRNDGKIYRIEVGTEKESLVRSAELVPVILNRMRKISGVSKQEIVRNGHLSTTQTIYSIIHPQALLLDDVEINVSDKRKSKQPVFQHPLKRTVKK